jgi:predicted RNase H-like HicB family nuclease/DNA-binding Xre family transcriptional regulator
MTSTHDELALVYGALLTREDDGIVVTFRDLENVFSWGETEEEAVFNAQEPLDGELESMAAHDHEVAPPSPLEDGEVPIPVSARVAAPLLLQRLRLQRDVSLAQVAKALGKSYQAVQRMERTGANLTLRSLEQTCAALGATVELRIVPTPAARQHSREIS